MVVDIRGPITPADVDGFRYVFVWMCRLCRGAYLTALRHLQGSEVRRAVTSSICRALTFPQLIGHDQGPELANAINEELVQRLLAPHGLNCLSCEDVPKDMVARGSMSGEKIARWGRAAPSQSSLGRPL